jgi:hypothetical protein
MIYKVRYFRCRTYRITQEPATEAIQNTDPNTSPNHP